MLFSCSCMHGYKVALKLQRPVRVCSSSCSFLYGSWVCTCPLLIPLVCFLFYNPPLIKPCFPCLFYYLHFCLLLLLFVFRSFFWSFPSVLFFLGRGMIIEFFLFSTPALNGFNGWKPWLWAVVIFLNHSRLLCTKLQKLRGVRVIFLVYLYYHQLSLVKFVRVMEFRQEIVLMVGTAVGNAYISILSKCCQMPTYCIVFSW